MTLENLKPGDLIGFSSWDWSGIVINAFTYGIPLIDLSHIGIMADHYGELVLFESTTLCPIPCMIQGRKVNGSQAHPLQDRLDKFYGRVYHYPLVTPLTREQEIKLSQFLHGEIGRPYDMTGALRSGGKIFSWLESRFRKSNDSTTLYCSEWCASAHHNVGLFRTRSASKWSPNAFVRQEYEQETIEKRIRLK